MQENYEVAKIMLDEGGLSGSSEFRLRSDHIIDSAPHSLPAVWQITHMRLAYCDEKISAHPWYCTLRYRGVRLIFRVENLDALAAPRPGISRGSARVVNVLMPTSDSPSIAPVTPSYEAFSSD